MIAIPNMDKPKSCDECWALDDKYDYPMCLITQEQRGYNFNTMTQIMDKCPLIEIVRCGECKKHGKNSCPMTFTYAVITDDNNYCTYAERKMIWEI